MKEEEVGMGNSVEASRISIANGLFSDEAVAKATEAAYVVLSEQFGMPYMARCRDYPNLDDLQRADAEAEAQNVEAVKSVVEAVITALKENSTDLAVQLKEARAAELEDFAVAIRIPKNRLSDTYTMRTLAEAALARAEEIRKA